MWRPTPNSPHIRSVAQTEYLLSALREVLLSHFKTDRKLNRPGFQGGRLV